MLNTSVAFKENYFWHLLLRRKARTNRGRAGLRQNWEILEIVLGWPAPFLTSQIPTPLSSLPSCCLPISKGRVCASKIFTSPSYKKLIKAYRSVPLWNVCIFTVINEISVSEILATIKIPGETIAKQVSWCLTEILIRESWMEPWAQASLASSRVMLMLPHGGHSENYQISERCPLVAWDRFRSLWVHEACPFPHFSNTSEHQNLINKYPNVF